MMRKRTLVSFGFSGVFILLPAMFASAQNIQFLTNIRRGSFGQDVSRLQEFLKTMPDVYPEGITTGYFGALTEKAVKRFQAKYGIEQVGVVGPKTRAKLNGLTATQASPQQPQLKQQKNFARPGTMVDVQKQPVPASPADQFSALEKELLGAKTSGSYLAPDHYNRINRDLTALEGKGYSAREIARLRALALSITPSIKDQQEPIQPMPAPAPQTASANAPPDTAASVQTNSTPILKNLGVNFEPWDKNTNRTGAFLFSPSENKLFLEYGAEVASSEGGTKILPTFEYRTAVDADVSAVMDGVITNVTYQERNQDYAIHIQPELNSQWTLEQDHIINLKISKGDTVKAGDILGKVGNLGGGFGRTEIMLWSSSGSRPLTYCPFKYFDPQLLSEYQQKVSRHMKDWEEFKGNPNLYSEEKHVFPGCAYESLLD